MNPKKAEENKSPENNTEHQSELIVDMFFSEGGFSLLIIFPLTVIFYLSMALSSI